MKGVKCILAAALVLCATVALASTEGGAEAAAAGHAAAAHHLDWWNFTLRVINFIIFAAILVKFGGKKAVEFFGGRRKQIETQLHDLDERKDKAEKRLAEVEKSIASLAAEKAKILDEYKAQGEALKASIVEKAEKDAAKIRAQAEAGAAQESVYKRRELRAEIAELVVEAAEKILKEKLTAEEQAKLVDKYLTKVVLN